MTIQKNNQVIRPAYAAAAAIAAVIACCQPQIPSVNDRIGSDGNDYLETFARAHAFTPDSGRTGGAFTFGVTREPRTLNPLIAADPVSQNIAGLLFEGLLRVDGVSGEVAPGLAGRWEESEDGAVVTLHLRQGLRWSDNTPITASDVVFTINEAIPASGSALSGPAALLRVCGDTVRAEMIDSLTLVVRFPRRCALALRALTLPVLPAHIARPAIAAGTFASLYNVRVRLKQYVVSGPFALSAYVPTQRLVLTRNAYYRGLGDSDGSVGRALLDSVIVSFVRDENVNMVRFRRGDFDYYAGRGEDYEILKENSPGVYDIHCMGPARNATALVFNQGLTGDSVRAALLRDIRFRRAAAHAIHRSAFTSGGRVFAQEFAVSPADTSFIPRGVQRYAYDTAASRRFLAQLGYTGRDSAGTALDRHGRVLQLTVLSAAGNAWRHKIAIEICRQLHAAGIDAQLQVIPYDSLEQVLRTRAGWEAVVAGLALPSEPLESWDLWHSSGRFHFWNAPGGELSAAQKQIDSAFAVSIVAPEATRRPELARALVRSVADGLPMIFTVLPERVLCVSSRLGNVNPSAEGGALHTLHRVFIRPSKPENALTVDPPVPE